MSYNMKLKSLLIAILCVMTCIYLSSCKNSANHNHEHNSVENQTHSHDGHDHHDHEGHDHAHEAEHVHGEDCDHSHEGHAHSHDAEHGHSHEGHDHSHEGHNHAAEAPHGHDGHDHGHAEGGNSDEIVLSPEKAAAAGVKVEHIHPGDFRCVLPASGQILPVPESQVTIVATVPGIVSYTYEMVEGKKVNAGAPVFFISSNNLQDGDPVLKAQIAYETAKSEYERAQVLVEDRIVSQQEFEAIKGRYETAKINYEALASDTESGKTAIKTPSKGFIDEILVKSGEYVTVGQPLATITDNSKLYLRADVSEKYLGQLYDVQSANFELAYSDKVYNIEELGGRFLAYGRSTDENSAFIPVTFVFNGNGEIMPGTFADVYLLSQTRKNVLTVPVTALTEEQGKFFIYIQIDPECYKKQEAVLGATDGRRVEILNGLQYGHNVVTEGALHVKLASASNAIPGHTHNH